MPNKPLILIIIIAILLLVIAVLTIALHLAKTHGPKEGDFCCTEDFIFDDLFIMSLLENTEKPEILYQKILCIKQNNYNVYTATVSKNPYELEEPHIIEVYLITLFFILYSCENPSPHIDLIIHIKALFQPKTRVAFTETVVFSFKIVKTYHITHYTQLAYEEITDMEKIYGKVTVLNFKVRALGLQKPFNH